MSPLLHLASLALAALGDPPPVEDFRPYVHPEPAAGAAPVSLERITTAVPWPRGLAWVEGRLVVLARGRHRNSGGIDPRINDRSGTLLVVDPEVAEPVVLRESAGEAVRANARVLVEPDEAVFHRYDPEKGKPEDDYLMDRPYCTLAWDAASRNYFICGYSGVDLPRGRFRKNATDAIHRFDTRSERWYAVEAHDPTPVAREDFTRVVPNNHYPHHDPATEAAPHGWLNGPNGACIAGDFLYAVGKDNHTLVQYELAEVRSNPDAPPPPSRLVFQEEADLRLDGERRRARLLGASALAAHEGYIYLGFRTSSAVIRFALDERGDVLRDASGELAPGELVGVFEPYDPSVGNSANLIDLTFDADGRLYAACATRGRVWCLGVPDPERVFDGLDGFPDAPRSGPNQPWVDLPVLTGKPRARVGNIVFDDQGRLYVCSGNYDSGSDLAGVIYRASPR